MSGARVAFCWRRVRQPGRKQQVMGLPGGLGRAVPGRLIGWKILQAMGQDANRLSQHCDTALERVHAIFNSRRSPDLPAG
jgi:hypothetical protein